MAVLDTNKTKKPYIVDREENTFIGLDLQFRIGAVGEGWGASTQIEPGMSDAGIGIEMLKLDPNYRLINDIFFTQDQIRRMGLIGTGFEQYKATAPKISPPKADLIKY